MEELGKKRGSHVRYKPSALPSSFEGVTAFDMMAYVRERLTKITPETSLSIAIKYLRDASFAFFMERAHAGITKSGSKDLVPHYEAILKGRVEEGASDRLRAIMDDLRKVVPDKGKEEGIAQRFKATFAMCKAGRLRCARVDY